jgi:hypothetical protein
MRFLTAEEIAAQYPPPPSADKLKLDDRNLLSPLEKLLLIINDDERDIDEVLNACRYALPYCHAVKQTEDVIIPPEASRTRARQGARGQAPVRRQCLRPDRSHERDRQACDVVGAHNRSRSFEY